MKTSRFLLTAAIAGIVAGSSASTVRAAEKTSTSATKKIKCYNTCTGKGACKTASHACKGKNSCAGDGKVIMTSAEECLKAGGLTTDPNGPTLPVSSVKSPST